MKKELIKLANHFDKIGLIKEADYVDALVRRYAQAEGESYTIPDEINLDDGRFVNEEAELLAHLSDEALSEELEEPDEDISIPSEPEIGGNPDFLGLA